MKIFVDEHIPLMTVRTLRLMGHDVRDIRSTPDEGMEDDGLWAMAQREERLLITTDKGFTQYRTVRHYGVLIIRLRRPNRQKIHARIMQAMQQFSESEWPGLLVTMRDVAQSTCLAPQGPHAGKRPTARVSAARDLGRLPRRP
jgi:predicted nuclease of predicted toxin-antitoxin system